MKLLDRYIGKTISGAALTVLFVLVGAFAFFALINEMDDVGRHRYGFAAMFQYIVLKIPALTYQLFPIAALIGTLMGLGALVASNEMVVIRSAGVSLLRVIGAVMKAGFILTLLTLMVGELVVPASEQLADNLRALAMHDRVTLKTKNGFWARDGNSFINIREVRPGNHFEQIYIYEFDKNSHLRVATYAQDASYEHGQWQLHAIRQSVFDGNIVQTRDLQHAAWNAMLKPELIDMVAIDPNSLSMPALAEAIRYLRQNRSDALRYELALWNKLTYPLATAAMVFLAIPMVFASARSASVGARVLVGSLVGVFFQIGNKAATSLAIVHSLNPVVCTVAPAALITVAAILLLRRVN